MEVSESIFGKHELEVAYLLAAASYRDPMILQRDGSIILKMIRCEDEQICCYGVTALANTVKGSKAFAESLG
jgi:hypothetical protein